jgi:hypothetical protein
MKHTKTDKEILRNIIEKLEYLEARDLIYCLSKTEPSINCSYGMVSFKVRDNDGKLKL